MGSPSRVREGSVERAKKFSGILFRRCHSESVWGLQTKNQSVEHVTAFLGSVEGPSRVCELYFYFQSVQIPAGSVKGP